MDKFGLKIKISEQIITTQLYTVVPSRASPVCTPLGLESNPL